LAPGKLWINFGFWDTVTSDTARPPGHVNRTIENEVMRLHGVKSLYSDSYFTPEAFAQVYATPAYEALKDKYDPLGRMLDLYDKCVLKA
jgi:FAD/FMN-containing dehydrogenase